jgi:PmbA protein
MSNDLDLLGDLVAKARAAGADSADAMIATGISLSVQRRLGETEHVERSERRDLGLRVFVGKRAAMVGATAVAPEKFAAMAEKAVAMARVLPEDPFGGLAEREDGAPDPTLDLVDPTEPDAALLSARAAAAEEAALAVVGITNSEGADASWGHGDVALVTSAGFAGQSSRTSHSISVSVVAGSGTGMQRDYEYHSVVHAADLDDPATLGRKAADKALTRLNPRRPRTAAMPIVYDPRVSASLLGHFVGAINGASVARGTSFLKDKLGQRVFAAGTVVRDDPRRHRGLRSRPFDAEGVATADRALVEDGVVLTWLLDSRSARQLGMHSTAHAARGLSSPPGPAPTNLYMVAGTLTPAELMSDIAEGLYVNELIGSGVNGVTGDYSRGASGFMIRDGALAEPVAEITIAGNLHQMFAHLTPANDLEFRRGTDAPTIRVDGMTMAGA